MASPLKYDGGLTCGIQVADFEGAIKWYQEVLGFSMLYRMDDLGWCELATEVANVNVGLSRGDAGGGSGGVVLTFGVVDIDDARAQLEAKDVRFDGPRRIIEGMVKLATFFDPDGNTLMLYQDLQKNC